MFFFFSSGHKYCFCSNLYIQTSKQEQTIWIFDNTYIGSGNDETIHVASEPLTHKNILTELNNNTIISIQFVVT